MLTKWKPNIIIYYVLKILGWILDAFGRLLGSLWEAFEPLGAYLEGPWALLGATLEVLLTLGVILKEIVVFLSGFGSIFKYVS